MKRGLAYFCLAGFCADAITTLVSIHYGHSESNPRNVFLFVYFGLVIGVLIMTAIKLIALLSIWQVNKTVTPKITKRSEEIAAKVTISSILLLIAIVGWYPAIQNIRTLMQ